MDENQAVYQIEEYVTRDQKSLFAEWTRRLRDTRARIAIERRVGRMELGNFGDHKFCREGVWELRFDLGPGYRVYYALAGTKLVLLLCGGDKGTQSADIDRACVLWKDYQQRG
jgi:putative addiction module killer protein